MQPLADAHMTDLLWPRGSKSARQSGPGETQSVPTHIPSLHHPSSGIVAEVVLSDDVRRLKREV